MSLDINDIAISAINSLGFSGSRYVTSSWNTSSNTAYVNIDNTYFRGYYFNDLRVTISFDNNGYLDQYSMSGYRSGSRFSESGLHNLSYSQRNSVEAAYDQIEAREHAEEQRIIAAAEAQKALEAAEALITQEKNELRSSFDASHYLEKYPDVKAAYGNNNELALDHYVRFGKAEGRSDVNEAEVQRLIEEAEAQKALEAAEALIAQEKDQLRDTFEANFYLARYSDVKEAHGENAEAALDHYVRFGKAEGRLAINSPPTNIILSSTSVKEKEVGLTVGALSVIDSTDSSHTLTLSGADANYFEIVDEKLKLKNDAVADYDVKKSYNLSVTGIDPWGLSYTKSFVINVLQISKEFQANTYTLDSQTNPSIAALNDGGFVVTWESNDQDGSGYGIYGQRYDSSGAKNGSEFQVNTYTLDSQTNPSIAALNDGGFLVTWDSFGQDGSANGIFSQRYDSNGARVGSEFQVNTYTSNVQTNPSIAALNDGGFLVTWESSHQDGSNYEIYGQRYSSSGVKIGSEFQVNTNLSNSQTNPSITVLNDGRFVVTWQSNDQDSSNYGIFGQLYNANGKAVDLVTLSNSSPADISLDNSTIEENLVGAHIANIIGSDPDDDTLTYSITGGVDAAMFTIVGTMLHLATGISADYENKTQLVVVIEASDTGGLTKSETFTIDVTDVLETQTGTTTSDTFNGSLARELVDGGAGVDLVSYSLLNKNVSFSLNSNDQLVIKNSAEQSDILISMERISLTDTSYALDTDGNAGTAAKVIISAFGAENLSSYMSSILSVVDGGKTIASLSDYVIELGLIDTVIGSSSNDSFVNHVFENVVGRLPNIVEQAIYTDYLDNGTYTKSSLLALAANTTLTENLVTANSIDLIGVTGSADGELLAIQYDIGLG